MTTFFWYTFWVGFGLTIVSAVLGVFDLGGGSDGGAGDISGADLTGDLSSGHAGDLSHGHGHSHGQTHSHGHPSAVSPVNFQTLVAFLMGFGGVGYLASKSGMAFWLLAVPLGTAGGLATGWVVFKFMKWLLKGETPLPPTSYVGVVGKLTVGIREGGTGELVYLQNRTYKVASARSESGAPIPKGEQVVVLRYEKGVAYVEPWRELMPHGKEQA